MKGWASLAFIAWLILCLLLSLGPQAGLNSQPPGDRSGTCRSKLPASSLPLPWVVASTAFHSAVTASMESVVLDCALTTCALGPPGRDTYRPPGTTKWLGHLSAKPPGQSNNRYPSQGIFCSPCPPNYRIGVLQQPLARMRVRTALPSRAARGCPCRPACGIDR